MKIPMYVSYYGTFVRHEGNVMIVIRVQMKLIIKDPSNVLVRLNLGESVL